MMPQQTLEKSQLKILDLEVQQLEQKITRRVFTADMCWQKNQQTKINQ